MDFSTIRDKIMNNKYKKLDEFKKDMSLIWSNAYKYNRKDSVVGRMAEQLSKLFNEQAKYLTGNDANDWNAKYEALSKKVDQIYPKEAMYKAVLSYLESGQIPQQRPQNDDVDDGNDTIIVLSQDQKEKIAKDIMSFRKGWMIMKIYKYLESAEPSFVKQDTIDADVTQFRRKTILGLQKIIAEIKEKESKRIENVENE